MSEWEGWDAGSIIQVIFAVGIVVIAILAGINQNTELIVYCLGTMAGVVTGHVMPRLKGAKNEKISPPVDSPSDATGS